MNLSKIFWQSILVFATFIIWCMENYFSPMVSELVAIPWSAWLSKSGAITALLLAMVAIHFLIPSLLAMMAFENLKKMSPKP